MKTKKLLSILVLILIIAIAYGTYAIALKDLRISDKNYTYIADLTWYRSLDKGLQMAKEENKPVAMYFWATWCQFCARFQTETLANPPVKKLLEEDFIIVAVDLDVDKDVANQYNGWPPPKVMFLDPNGEVVRFIDPNDKISVDAIYGARDASYFMNAATQVRDKVRSK